MKYARCPIRKVYPVKSKAIKRPEERSGLKPHLVENEMGEGAEGKDGEPDLPVASVEVKSSKGNDKEK